MGIAEIKWQQLISYPTISQLPNLRSFASSPKMLRFISDPFMCKIQPHFSLLTAPSTTTAATAATISTLLKTEGGIVGRARFFPVVLLEGYVS